MDYSVLGFDFMFSFNCWSNFFVKDSDFSKLLPARGRIQTSSGELFVGIGVWVAVVVKLTELESVRWTVCRWSYRSRSRRKTLFKIGKFWLGRIRPEFTEDEFVAKFDRFAFLKSRRFISDFFSRRSKQLSERNI